MLTGGTVNAKKPKKSKYPNLEGIVAAGLNKTSLFI